MTSVEIEKDAPRISRGTHPVTHRGFSCVSWRRSSPLIRQGLCERGDGLCRMRHLLLFTGGMWQVGDVGGPAPRYHSRFVTQ